tara:strand:+ start:758 stop:1795 length:1038 start_codon:yes stop_codon:yes gene_type:complete
MKPPAGKAVAKRYEAVSLYEKLRNYSQVANRLGVKRDFVKRWVERSRTGNGLLVDAERSGRPPKLGPEKTKELLELVDDQSKPLFSAENYKNALQEKGVSVRTFKRVLKKAGGRYAAPQKERILTEVQMEKRYKFAKKYHDSGPWKQTMFTDSTYIYNGQGCKRWVLKGKKNKNKQHRKPDKVHVYAGITYKGKTDLCFVTGTTGLDPYKKKSRGVTGVEYQERVVKRLFMPAARQLFGNEKWQFLQDGAPAHTAKTTKELLRDICEGWIQDYPSNSCDLNPIENVWEELKRMLRGRNFTSMAEFKAAVRKAWAQMPLKKIRKPIGSMRRRLRAVAQAKGGLTKY